MTLLDGENPTSSCDNLEAEMWCQDLTRCS
jgi:hypothetical protein